VLFDETQPHAGLVAERVASYRAAIGELVAGALLGQLPPKRREAARIEVEALSAALLGAAEALARWWLRTEAVSAAEAAELLISTFEPGLLARSAPSSKPSSRKPRKGGRT
jgi:hypothetical protein